MEVKNKVTLLLAEKEKVAGKGEDAYAYCYDTELQTGYLAVYDGCGGMGAKKYPEAGEKTGAYIASRVAAFMTERCFSNQGFACTEADAMNLGATFAEAFANLGKHFSDENGIKIKGSLFKEFPTTASVITVKYENTTKSLQCAYLWAGDSRGYYLDKRGLCQVTEDDVYTEEDAFTSLRNDAKLKNVVHADGSFTLHGKTVVFRNPTLLFTATDGVFGYFLTPMHVEYVILSSLYESQNVAEWEAHIRSKISAVSGDDFALVGAIYGFSDISEIKEYYRERYDMLCRMYITPAQNASYEQLHELWKTYKTDYERK